MENQIDDVASTDNNSGNSNSSAVHKDTFWGRSKSDMLKRAIRKLRSSKTVKFILFTEDFPRHHVIEDISSLHAVLVFYFCLFIGFFGFMVLASATFLGFIAYYVAVAMAVLEVLHYFYDR